MLGCLALIGLIALWINAPWYIALLVTIAFFTLANRGSY
jgi:hypothetical protein